MRNVLIFSILLLYLIYNNKKAEFMNDPIQEYQDFIMSDEEREEYVDPIIMDNYQDRQAIYRIKSQIEVAASKVYYWIRQGGNALAHVVFGGLIGVGFIAIVSKLAHFTI